MPHNEGFIGKLCIPPQVLRSKKGRRGRRRDGFVWRGRGLWLALLLRKRGPLLRSSGPRPAPPLGRGSCRALSLILTSAEHLCLGIARGPAQGKRRPTWARKGIPSPAVTWSEHKGILGKSEHKGVLGKLPTLTVPKPKGKEEDRRFTLMAHTVSILEEIASG